MIKRGAPRRNKYLFQRKPDGKWYGRIFDADGVWRQRALSMDKSAADDFRAELQRQEDRKRFGLEDVGKQDQRIEPVLKAYVDEIRAGIGRKRTATKKYASDCERACRQMIKLLVAIRFSDIRFEKVIDARQQLAQPEKMMRGKVARVSTRSTRSINRIVLAFRTFLQWAWHTDRIKVNPIARLKKLPETQATVVHARHALTVEQAMALIAAANAIDARRGTDRIPQAPMLRFFLETGFRLSEARNIERRDLRKIGDEWAVRVRPELSKTDTERLVPLRHPMAARLQSLFANHEDLLGRKPGPIDCVFRTPTGKPWAQANVGNLRRWLSLILKEAGLPRRVENGKHIDFHALRHSFNTFLAENGVGRDLRQMLMGHADASVNAIYTERGRVVRPLVDAVSKLPSFERSVSASEAQAT